MESDSILLPKEDNLDIIDEDWRKDCLSDDEIEIPHELDPILDDAYLDPLLEITKPQEEKWVDLGLDGFLNGIN